MKFQLYYLNYFILLILIFLLFKNQTIENFEANSLNLLIIGATSEIAEIIIKSNHKYNFYLLGRNITKLNKLKEKFSDRKINVGIINFENKESIDKFVSDNVINFDLVYNNYYDSNKSNDIHHQFNTNVSNNIYLLKKIVPFLNTGSKLINISSGASDIIDFDESDDFLIYYSLIKNLIEKFTKVLSRKLYHKSIGVTCLKIDNTYNTQLTRKKIKKQIKLNDPILLMDCFTFLNKSNWKEVTGKILYSQQLLKNSSQKLLDSNLINSNIISSLKSITENKQYIGENPVKMSSNINKFLKNHSFDLEKYSSGNGKLRKLLSSTYNINSEQINFFNGILDFLDKFIFTFVKKGHNVICPSSWMGTLKSTNNYGILLIESNNNISNNMLEDNFDSILSSINSFTRIIYLVAPIIKSNFNSFIKKIPKSIIVIIDFCYFNFYEEDKNYLKVEDINFDNNLIICLFTFSKFYSIPQLQLGFSITSIKNKELIDSVISYDLSSLKEEIAMIAIKDNKRNFESKKYYTDFKKYAEDFLNNKKISFFFDKNFVVYLLIDKKNRNKFFKLKDKYFIFLLKGYTGIPLVAFKDFQVFLE